MNGATTEARPIPTSITQTPDLGPRGTGEAGLARSPSRSATASCRGHPWTAMGDGLKIGDSRGSSATAGASRASGAVVEEGCRIGLDQLTLYCLSVENWKRPTRELKFLLRLLRHFVIVEREELMDQKVRLVVIGRPRRSAARRPTRARPDGRGHGREYGDGSSAWRSITAAGPRSPTPRVGSPRKFRRAGLTRPMWTRRRFPAIFRRPGCPTRTS